MFVLILTIIIILLLIILCVSYYPKWDVYNYHLFHKLIKFYGPPTFVDPYKKGVAVWKFNKNNDGYGKIPFKRIMMLDTNTEPLFITITYDIDSKKMCDILELDKSIIYDRTSNELTLRGKDIPTIMAMFVFIDKYNQDKIKKSDSSKIMKNKKKEMLDNYKYLLDVKKNMLTKLIEF
jgi:hypothetical protein